jgi:hypothetical protein
MGFAGFTLAHNRERRTRGDKIRRPVLLLSGSKGKLAAWYTARAR